MPVQEKSLNSRSVLIQDCFPVHKTMVSVGERDFICVLGTLLAKVCHF